MKFTLAALAVAASLGSVEATWGWTGAPRYNTPGNCDNKCEDGQQGGWHFGDLDYGSFDKYQDFDFKGWTCGEDKSKRDLKTRTFGRSIKAECGSEPSAAPSFGCGSNTKIDKFSVKKFHVKPEFDCRLEFHYEMPDGSSCKHSADCSKDGTDVENTQCGGAKTVKFVYPKQDKPKDKCQIEIPQIDFDCDKPTNPCGEGKTCHGCKKGMDCCKKGMSCYDECNPGEECCKKGMDCFEECKKDENCCKEGTECYNDCKKDEPCCKPGMPCYPAEETSTAPAAETTTDVYPPPGGEETTTEEGSAPTSSVPEEEASTTTAPEEEATSTDVYPPPGGDETTTEEGEAPTSSVPEGEASTSTAPEEEATSTDVYPPPGGDETTTDELPGATTSEGEAPTSSVPEGEASTTTAPEGEASSTEAYPPPGGADETTTEEGSAPTSSVPEEEATSTVPEGSAETTTKAYPPPGGNNDKTTTDELPGATTSVPEAEGSTTEVTSEVVTTYETTSTIYTTDVKTITDCGDNVPDCPAGSTKVTTVTVPVTTTVCPVTETIPAKPQETKPAEGGEKPGKPGKPGKPSKGDDKPVDCPEVVPSCLNTFLDYLEDCKDNSDASCFCPKKDFVDNVFKCLYAHGGSDDIVAQAVSFFQGICAPYAGENPGIVTGAEPITKIITVTGTTVVPTAVYTTVVVATTVTEPCVTDGTTIEGSSTVRTVSHEVTVPDVGFTTAPSGGVVLVPPPTSTGYGALPSETIVTQPPAGTGNIPVPTKPSSPTEVPVTAGAGRVGMGIAAALFAAALAL